MLALLLAVLLPSALSVSTAAAAQQQAQRCENVNSIVFLGLVPCSREGAVTEEDLERCDLLAQVAVELAVEHINARDDVLPRNTSLEVRRTPDVSTAANVSLLPQFLADMWLGTCGCISVLSHTEALLS